MHNLSVGQVPERLTQLWYEAENSGDTRPILSYSGVGQFWWGGFGGVVVANHRFSPFNIE